MPVIEGSTVVYHLQKWDESNCVSLQPIVNLDCVDAPPIVNHYTAFSDMYAMFFYFLSLKIKIIVFIPIPSNLNFATKS